MTHTNHYRPLFGDSEVITLESSRVLRSTLESTFKPMRFQQGNNFAAGKATHLPDIQLPSESFRRALINVVLVSLENGHVFKTHGVVGYGTLKFETPPIYLAPIVSQASLGFVWDTTSQLSRSWTTETKDWDNRRQHVHVGCVWIGFTRSNH